MDGALPFVSGVVAGWQRQRTISPRAVVPRSHRGGLPSLVGWDMVEMHPVAAQRKVAKAGLVKKNSHGFVWIVFIAL